MSEFRSIQSLLERVAYERWPSPLSSGAVVAALAANPAIAARSVGVSLSKVKLDKRELFDAREGYGYGSQYMSRYYHRTPEHSLGVGN